MPKSKVKKNSDSGFSDRNSGNKQYKGNSVLFKPVMFGLMLLGLLWIMVFYLSQGLYPVRDIGYWNIFIGFAIVMCGFLMTTRWRS